MQVAPCGAQMRPQSGWILMASLVMALLVMALLVMTFRCQDLLQLLSMKTIVGGKACGKISMLRATAFPVSVIAALLVRSVSPELGTPSKASSPSPAIRPAVI
jgi:hypothetical protein